MIDGSLLLLHHSLTLINIFVKQSIGEWLHSSMLYEMLVYLFSFYLRMCLRACLNFKV